jgi:hypothetical protein
MLFKHNARDKRYFDLFRVNIVTGKSELLFENNEFAWYVTDSDFQLRLGARFAADGSAENMVRRSDGIGPLHRSGRLCPQQRSAVCEGRRRGHRQQILQLLHCDRYRVQSGE